MALLEQERIRLQAAIDAAAAEVSARQQALLAAQARVGEAQTQVAEAQSRLPALQSAAAAADARVANAEAEVQAHMANEPDPTIDVEDGRPPRPNPAWRVWKRQLDQLRVQRDQAQAAAAAAHGALGNGQRAVVQAQMAEQLTQRQVEEATAARRSGQSALNVAQQNMADLERWLAEIARDPLQRTALEQVASQVSTRALALQESLTLARFAQEDTESRLASLVARRNQLNDTLVDVNGRIPGAQTEVEAAQEAADAASAELFDFVATGE